VEPEGNAEDALVPFASVAAAEALVAAACAAVAACIPHARDELCTLGAAHLATALRLHARPRRWRRRVVTARATLAAVAGSELGALVWLRRQEQGLVDAYMALEGSLALQPMARQRLRRELVPGAFERFSRVDRLIMLREEQGVYA
jgi:hypothetical protein